MNLDLKKKDFQMGLISLCTTLSRDPIGGRGIPDRYPHTVSCLPFKVLKTIRWCFTLPVKMSSSVTSVPHTGHTSASGLHL
jgi:hypothetical protein